MTRLEDIEAAIGLGARYVGVIFASGQRTVSVDQARRLVQGVPRAVGRVGVFGRELEPPAAADVARSAGLDVIQLHADPDPADVERARSAFGGPVWGVVRVRGSALPVSGADLFRVADAVVLDTYSPGALGGTGVALPWDALEEEIARVRKRGKLVLAGGLRPESVSDAVRLLRPDVVDVSSGVEAAPGVKDPAKLRAFRDAVMAERARP